MIGAILLLGLSRAILPGEPPAFQNYFDDSVKGVDISQDSAIKACLQNGDAFADKVKAAYNKCFGNDYDFDDLAGAVGSSDEDSDGLPDSFEGNEACFYEEMGWVAGSGAADADAIKADMAGLDAGLKGDFDANIDACAAWSGSFGSRVRREAVPELMGSGRAALNWLRSAVRKTRSADPEKEKESGKGKKNTSTEKKVKEDGKGKRKSGKKSDKKDGKKKGTRKTGKKLAKKNGKKKGTRKTGKKSAKKNGNKKGTRKTGKKSAKKKGKKKGTRKTGKKSAKKNGKKKGTRKTGKKSAKKNGKKKARKSGKKSAKKNGKKKGTRKSGKKSARKDGKKKARKSGKKSAKTNEKKSDKKEKTSDKKEKTSDKKEKKVLDEQTYNKLWCFDLSMEQVLETCVEEKIKN